MEALPDDTAMKISSFMTIERSGEEKEVKITAEANAPEHDVGIMNWWFEDVCAESEELTEKEVEHAEEILTKKLNDDYYEPEGYEP